MTSAPELSLVLVHYRTPELLAPCLEALARSAAEAGLVGRVEALVVDNGGAPPGLASPEGLAVAVVDANGNRGFAGGVNLGIRRARGRMVVVMNPDVEVEPRCLGALVAALDAGFDAAGPLLHWDQAGRLLLPPTEVRSRSAELRRRLAGQSRARQRAARLAWRNHARRFWCATSPEETFDLSGAMLALRRDSFERVGPFDEGFRLYFEESDWLRRLRRAGGRAALVPAARARHAFARSSRREPAAAAWFAESAERFARQSWGEEFVLALGRRTAAGGREPEPESWLETLATSGRPGWLEVSPSAAGFPAAGERLEAAESRIWTLPADVVGSWDPGTELFVREVDDDGTELACARLVVAA